MNTDHSFQSFAILGPTLGAAIEFTLARDASIPLSYSGATIVLIRV